VFGSGDHSITRPLLAPEQLFDLSLGEIDTGGPGYKGFTPIPPGSKLARIRLEHLKGADRHCKQPRLHIMKHLIPVVFAAFVLVACDKQKAAIDDKKEATKNVIDNRKDAVDAAATAAKKQTEVDAAIEKAKIEANKVAAQAQLDADKKKADAQAAFEKAKLDAEKK
jgi:hypothetical protein